jgi:alpha/beta superfamily hydrolase
MQLLMRRPEIAGFVSVAPPANLYDFNFLAPCPASGLIVQGDQDQIVDPAAVAALAKKLTNQRGVTVTYKAVKGADHFFRDHLDELAQAVDEYIAPAIAAAKVA